MTSLLPASIPAPVIKNGCEFIYIDFRKDFNRQPGDVCEIMFKDTVVK